MSPEVRALTEVARCTGAASPPGRARTPATSGKPRRNINSRWRGPGRCFPTSPSRQWPDAKAGVVTMDHARSAEGRKPKRASRLMARPRGGQRAKRVCGRERKEPGVAM